LVDEFYWVDLVGLSVHNREGLDLGVVTEIMSSGAQCVMVIKPSEAFKAETLAHLNNHSEDGHRKTNQVLEKPQKSKIQPKDTTRAQVPDCLIPFVSQYVDDVDLKAGVIKVDWQVDY
jgi:16S rRNA processing protein RimM